MASIVSVMCTSHAFTFREPDVWDEYTERNRNLYKKRMGKEAKIQPKAEAETLECNKARYELIRSGLDALARHIREKKPDALVVIGDDQNENFNEDNLPQFSIFTGEAVRTDNRVYACHRSLAETLLKGTVKAGFDTSFSRRFPEQRLRSHAHGPLLERIMGEQGIPIVPIFVNSIWVPAPEPQRCSLFGQTLKRLIEEARPAAERVMVVASGGLSHFTGGYPWHDYQGTANHGFIDEAFDIELLHNISAGEGRAFVERLTSEDLIEHGEIELRSWIMALGMTGGAKGNVLAHESFYRAIMGMGIVHWDLEEVGT